MKIGVAIILLIFILIDIYNYKTNENISVVGDSFFIKNNELIKVLNPTIENLKVEELNDKIGYYYTLNNNITLLTIMNKSDNYIKYIGLSLNINDDTKENDRALGYYIGKILNIFNLNGDEVIKKLNLNDISINHNKYMYKHNVKISFCVFDEKLIFSMSAKSFN